MRAYRAKRPLTLSEKIEARLSRKKGDVFLRADFEDLGGYDQVGVVLRQFVRAGKLLKISQGIYTRAEPSIIDGRPVPTKDLTPLMTEALGRIGVRVRQTRLERDYLAGRSTQVPTGRRIGVDRRVRRKFGYNGANMSFERA